ncbi:phenazine biosynthesis protein [Auriculariales sp. MPI-PUGE-AT-0066]|nr:phenazine biosynthesis protein [Auriculariales sp. MPI-PUGE-AT-0066]
MSPREIPYTIVDAFTKDAFAGNPAAVIVLDNDNDIADDCKQRIATEFNLSDTAYCSKTGDGDDIFDLCWFTPADEISLCGHATLATAHVILAAAQGSERTITFRTRRAGNLVVSKTATGLLEMALPAGSPDPPPEGLLERVKDAVAKALSSDASLKSIVEDIAIGPQGPPYWNYLVIRISDAVDLKSLVVNAEPLAQLAPYAVICFTNGPPESLRNSGVHFFSRVFAPLYGVNEDPVCGSAHGILAPYWTKLLGVAGQALIVKQVSARGGDLELEWIEEANMVKFRGHATTVAKGTILLPTES